MTNYEWVVTNKKEMVEHVLALYLGKTEGEIRLCEDIDCSDCDFKRSLNNDRPCKQTTKKWLEAEHEPLYKKGDILILEDKDIAIVTREDDANSVIVSHNIECAERGEGWRVPFDLIKRKIGNVYDE